MKRIETLIVAGLSLGLALSATAASGAVMGAVVRTGGHHRPGGAIGPGVVVGGGAVVRRDRGFHGRGFHGGGPFAFGGGFRGGRHSQRASASPWGGFAFGLYGGSRGRAVYYDAAYQQPAAPQDAVDGLDKSARAVRAPKICPVIWRWSQSLGHAVPRQIC